MFATHYQRISFPGLLLLISVCLSAQVTQHPMPPQSGERAFYRNEKKGSAQPARPPVLLDPREVIRQKKWNLSLSQHGVKHGTGVSAAFMDSIKSTTQILLPLPEDGWARTVEVPDMPAREITSLAPQMNQNFKGNTYNYWSPPDNNLAVSDQGFVVSVANSNILMTDEQGNRLAESNFEDFMDFLHLAGVYYDPKVMYDPEEDKFILVVLNGNTPQNTFVVIGFSTTGNPLDKWWFYVFYGDPTGSNLWMDYPSIGITVDDLYISGNLFTADNHFSQVLIYQLHKHPGFSGETVNGLHWADVRDGYGFRDFSVNPISYGFDGALSPGTFLLSTNENGGNEATLYYTDNDALNNPNLLTYTVALPNYYPPFNGTMKGTDDKIVINDCRLLNGFYANGYIHFVIHTRGDDFHSKLLYTRLKTDDLTETHVQFGQAPFEFAYPCIAPFSADELNKSVLIGFLRTGGSIYPELRAIACADDFTLTNPLLLKEGESVVNFYKNATERWGDYIGISRRHNANTPEIWIAGNYADDQENGDANMLNTWIAQVTDGPPSALPVAAFSADLTEITPGGMVHFTDHSTANPIAWEWNFPGGTPAVSTQQHPVVTYAIPGTYDVKLTVTNAQGFDEELKASYIRVTDGLDAPVADFTSDATMVGPGDPVTFTDLSLHTPTSWQWSFPGGTPESSNLQNPVVAYTDPGCYDVSLLVANAAGNDLITRTCYVEVLPTATTEPDAVFTKFLLYPNPVSPGGRIHIAFTMSRAAELDFLITDTEGKIVHRLMQRRIKAGDNEIGFDTEPLSGGTYYLAVQDPANQLIRSQAFVVLQ